MKESDTMTSCLEVSRNSRSIAACLSAGCLELEAAVKTVTRDCGKSFRWRTRALVLFCLESTVLQCVQQAPVLLQHSSREFALGVKQYSDCLCDRLTSVRVVLGASYPYGICMVLCWVRVGSVAVPITDQTFNVSPSLSHTLSS